MCLDYAEGALMKIEIELERQDFETLLLMAGTALMVAARQGDSHLCRRYLMLANTINAKNPDWTPYEIPPDWSGPCIAKS